MRCKSYILNIIVIATIFFVTIFSFSITALAQPNGKVSIGLSAELFKFDPHKADWGFHSNYIVNVFDGLYNRNWKGELIPGIALSHEVKDNGLTYIFKIRKGVKFHNGDPLTAEDVKFSYDRARDPATKCGYASWWRNMDRVEVLDPYTVAVYWKKPNAAFINQTTQVVIGPILPKKYFEKVGDKGFLAHPVGTGYYKFASYMPSQKLILEAFEDYWGEVPEVKTIEIKFIPELGARLAALKTGEIQIMMQVPPFDAEAIKLMPGLKIIGAGSGAAFYYAFNPKVQPAFNDLRVRQAFNYAINKKMIAEKIYRGNVSIQNNFAPPSLPGYDPKCPGYPYNPEKAKKLLAEANYNFDTPVTIDIAQGRWSMNEESSLAISSNLAAIGINAKVRYMEYSHYINLLNSREPDALINNQRSNHAWDAEGSFRSALHSGGKYVYRQNSPELDKMIDELSNIYDINKRNEQFRKIYWKTYEEASVIFLWEWHSQWGVSDKIKWKVGAGEDRMHLEELKLK